MIARRPFDGHLHDAGADIENARRERLRRGLRCFLRTTATQFSEEPSMANNQTTQTSHFPLGRKSISGLILLHLIALVIGVVSNAGYESPLRTSLRSVPLVTDYLQLLNMDQAYDDALTYGAPEDGVHQLQFALDRISTEEVPAEGESSESSKSEILLPDESTWPRIRRRRYENLAFQIDELAVAFEGDPHSQTLLAVGVARRLLREIDAPPGTHTLRCLRWSPVPLEIDNPDDFSMEAEVVVETRLLSGANGELRIALQEEENLTAGVVLDTGEVGPNTAKTAK